MSEDKSYFTIKAPEVAPKIPMKNPEFHRLTSAEKLNDSDYRNLIYQTYPNERICACSKDPDIDVRKFQVIGQYPGNCANSCCSTSRKPVPGPKNPNHLFESSGTPSSRCSLKNSEVRMRGGGCEELYQRWEALENSRVPRIPKVNNLIDHSPNTYEPPNYYYTPREDHFPWELRGNPQSSPKNPGKCSAKQNICGDGPCIGADCFQRTLQETQELVDSFGRVPGLAGLGLQDPSESPYFRTRELPLEDLDNFPVKDPKIKRRSSRAQNPRDSVLIKTKPFTLPSSRRETLEGTLGNFSANLNNSEVPEGSGPCGDASCRARRRMKRVSSSHDLLNTKVKERRSSHRSSRVRRLSRRHKVPGSVELRPRRIQYVYLAGDTYPGGAFGHKNCGDPRKRVPANMGWLWNSNQSVGRLKPRVGWRPGALSRTLREIIKETKAGALEDVRSRSRSRLKNRSQTSMKKNPRKVDEEEEEPPATLRILRKNGTYYVTMYPIKQEEMEVPQLEVPMKPLQFKIAKDKDESDSESSTASDLEIEFSPPAAVSRYRKKPDVVHVDVQVKQQEILDAFKPPGEKKKEKKGKKGKK